MRNLRPARFVTPVLLVTTTFLAACSGNDETKAPVGTWSFACRPLGPPGLFFAGTNVTTTKDWQITIGLSTTGDGCDDPVATFRSYGPHEVGEALDSPPGAREMDFIVTARVLTLRKESARAALAEVGCDTASFAIGEDVNVNATGCGPLFASLRQCPADYDIFKVEGNTLYIGQRPAPPSDICAPERRPTMLATDWAFIRQH